MEGSENTVSQQPVEQQAQTNWRKLPDHIIVEWIVPKLTAYDVVRLRCVCTRLGALLRNLPSSICTATRPNVLLLGSSIHHLGAAEIAYDPTLDAWIRLPLSFLRSSLLQEYGHLYPVASSNGALCFGSGPTFIVCNPLTQSCRKLPSVPSQVLAQDGRTLSVSFGEDYSQAFGFARDPSTGTLRLTVLNASSYAAIVLSYSSLTGRWTGFPAPAQLLEEHPSLQTSGMVSCHSDIYVLVWTRLSQVVWHVKPDEVCGEIEGPDCSSPLLRPHLFNRHGRLHMVGGVGMLWLGHDIFEHPTSVRIWELDSDSKGWNEVLRMPHAILQEFTQRVDFDTLVCCGKDDLLYMRSPESDVLMYDFALGSWKWLTNETSFNMELRTFLLEPSLSARV